MNVKKVEIASLSPDPANVRRHPEGQITKLMGMLRRWGQTLPLLVDGNGVVRVGNARLEAMTRLGWDKVNVVRLDLSPSEWTALAIADNKSHDDSEFDEAALANVLASLRAEDADLAEAAGYTVEELANLLGDQTPTEDEAPESFPEVGEDIHTDFKCPRCSYAWSGSSAPAGASA